MKPQTLTLRILLLKEGSQWVAQCLEYDVAAQGPEVEDAIERLGFVLAAKAAADKAAGRQPLSTCPPAPEMYQAMAQQAKHVSEQPSMPLLVPEPLPVSLAPQLLMVL